MNYHRCININIREAQKKLSGWLDTQRISNVDYVNFQKGAFPHNRKKNTNWGSKLVEKISTLQNSGSRVCSYPLIK